MIFAYLIRR